MLQPGQKVDLPPFPSSCGAGERAFVNAALLAERCWARVPANCRSPACRFRLRTPFRLPARLAAHAGVEVSEPAGPNCNQYVVVQGDTLSSIATMVSERAPPGGGGGGGGGSVDSSGKP